METIELKKDIKEIIEAKANGQKLRYVANYYPLETYSKSIQIYFDSIAEFGGVSLIFCKGSTSVLSCCSELIKLKFTHYNKESNSIHYDLIIRQ